MNVNDRIVSRFGAIPLILLCMAVLSAEPWEGRYQWSNPTTKTNDGKMVVYTIEVRTAPSGALFPYELYHVGRNGSLKFFPLMQSESEANQWVAWDAPGSHAAAYRENARMFNTTAVPPIAWRLRSQDFSDGVFTAEVTNQVPILQFTFTTRMQLLVLEDGRRALAFTMKGTGISEWGIFKNPKPGPHEDASTFLLIKQ